MIRHVYGRNFFDDVSERAVNNSNFDTINNLYNSMVNFYDDHEEMLDSNSNLLNAGRPAFDPDKIILEMRKSFHKTVWEAVEMEACERERSKEIRRLTGAYVRGYARGMLSSDSIGKITIEKFNNDIDDLFTDFETVDIDRFVCEILEKLI